MKFAQPQWITGWIELQENNDSIPADDSRPIAFRIEQPPKVLVLTKSSKKAEANSAFFLRQALEVIAGTSRPSDKTNSPSAWIQSVQPDNDRRLVVIVTGLIVAVIFWARPARGEFNSRLRIVGLMPMCGMSLNVAYLLAAGMVTVAQVVLISVIVAIIRAIV